MIYQCRLITTEELDLMPPLSGNFWRCTIPEHKEYGEVNRLTVYRHFCKDYQTTDKIFPKFCSRLLGIQHAVNWPLLRRKNSIVGAHTLSAELRSTLEKMKVQMLWFLNASDSLSRAQYAGSVSKIWCEAKTFENIYKTLAANAYLAHKDIEQLLTVQ